MVLKLSKQVHFLQFFLDISKKFKSAESIYVYVSETSHNTLSENGMVYRGLSHRYEIFNDWNIKDVDSAEIWQNSLASNSNIS